MHRCELRKLAASFAIPPTWDETVTALTDLIIPTTDTPGAKAAHVNRYIDLDLRDGDPQQAAGVIPGLSRLDADSIQQDGHPFVHLTPAQQTALLQSMDAATGPAHDFFQRVKFATAGIYDNTQIGYQELNKGGRVPATFGCNHQTHA